MLGGAEIGNWLSNDEELCLYSRVSLFVLLLTQINSAVVSILLVWTGTAVHVFDLEFEARKHAKDQMAYKHREEIKLHFPRS